MDASDGSQVLSTPRLRLRELEADDFEAVHAYASDPEVVQYMPWGPNTEQDTRDFLTGARASAAADPRSGFELAVVTRSDGRLIGAAGVHLSGDRMGALGYCYHPRAWGHGYATEAAEALLGLGFDVLHLHRIHAECDPDNHASARVLEKVGLRREGRLREALRIQGEYRDSLIYGILEREWRRRGSIG